MPRLPERDRELSENNHPVLADEMAARLPLKVQFQPPAPRSTWREDVVQSYDAYWSDVAASAARELDVAKIVRYFDLLEIEARIYDELIDLGSLTVQTSSGSMQASPLIAALARIVSTSIKLANEIGATPMSRLKLGLTKVEGQNALLELDRRLRGNDDDQEAVVGDVPGPGAVGDRPDLPARSW